MTPAPTLPLLGFAAWSGTGKTTLLEQLIPLLVDRGLRIGVLKHAHHDFDIDQPGKDSYRLRKAGAQQMMVASRRRHARIIETELAEADFRQLLASFDQTELDLLLVEGFKHEHFPKIELHRAEIGKPLLFPKTATSSRWPAISPQRPPCRNSISTIWRLSPTSSAAGLTAARARSRRRARAFSRSRRPATPFWRPSPRALPAATNRWPSATALCWPPI